MRGEQRRLYKNATQLYHMGNVDSLTGLTNRVIFEDRFATAIAGAKRYGRSVGVLYLDIDGLNEINANIGNQAGDMVLKETALRLEKNTRQMDTVARVAEDEFVVLLSDLKSEADISVVENKINQALERPFELNGEEHAINVSIGAAVFPTDGQLPEQLVNAANSQMYRAKRTHKPGYASLQS